MTKRKDWADWAPEKNEQLPGIAAPEQSGVDFAPQGHGRTAAGARKHPKPFDVVHSVLDDQTLGAPVPKCAKRVIAAGMFGGAFVPVSFVAKDWNVTPRRIRFLLAAGRLAGRLQDNGYWEVCYPYSFTFGTRGPGLKRQQKPERRPKKPELRAV